MPGRNTTNKEDRPPAALNGALWRFSDARQILAQDLIDGVVPLEGDVDSEDLYNNLWADKAAFANFPFDRERYDDRIKSMRQQVKGAQDSAALDHANLMKDCLKYPARATNIQGKPRWHGSEAEWLLKIDLANEKHLEEGYKPSKLWLTRPAYTIFSVTVFRKHVNQTLHNAKPFPETDDRRTKNKNALGKKEESRLL